MRRIEELLKDLAVEGVILKEQDGRLHYRAPKVVMTPARIAELKTQRDALLDFLQNEGAYAPLTHGQQALWFIHQNEPASPAYNIPVPLRIHARDFDIARLKASLLACVARHPMLRATFTTHAGKALQKISKNCNLAWNEIAAADWSEAAIEREIYNLSQQAFDLAQGPLIRATLFCRADTPVLMLCAHHIVCDDWSAQVILDDLRALYGGVTPALLPQIESDYFDYVHREAEVLSKDGPVLAAYWKNQLAGDLPVLSLPTDRPRPSMTVSRGATESLRLSSDLSRRLNEFARTEGVTLYTILLAAFAVLLRRYCAQDELIIGSPTSMDRSQREFARTVGYFVNPIALRIDTSGEPDFVGFVRRLHRTVLDGLAHHAYPFPLLVKEVQPRRDPSRSPIFQSLFVFQNLHMQETKHADLDPGFEVLETRQMEAQFDLILVMEDDTAEGALSGAFKYSADLFDASTIARLSEHWRILLEAAAATPTTPLNELRMLSERERRQMLIDWNADARGKPEAFLDLTRLFEAQVWRNPEAIAVVGLGDASEIRLTYAELDVLSNRFAHRLQSMGIGGPHSPESVIGVHLESSPEAIVALLGIWKAACVYLPLDPAYPAERLEFMIRDAEVCVIVTRSGATLPPAARGLPQLVIDSLDQDLVGYPASRPGDPLPAERLAYVIYTSGSTGQPKGVLIEHRGLSNLAVAQSKAFGIRPGSRVLQAASLNFDASISEIVTTLVSGATLFLAPREKMLPGPGLAELFETRQITHVTLTPSALAVMPQRPLPDLESLIVAGEACSAELVQRWATGRRFFNAYGPTENTVCATIMECTCTDTSQGIDPPIGRPMQNVETYVLDPQQQPVPIGVHGELYLGGTGLARGYLNRPELTAEKFIEVEFRFDPAGPETRSVRLYRTGDRVRYLSDRNIEYLGRIDQQLKIRGFRIEPGEIEARLKAVPGVRDAAVVARGEGAAKRLVAYWLRDPRRPLSDEQLRRELNTMLPEYMLPSLWILLDHLPLTVQGKVDRQALLEIPLRGTETDSVTEEPAPPRDEFEKSLAAIWEELLQVPVGDIQADFFEFGGHSLLAVSLLSRIEQQFGQRLLLSDFLQAPTIERLAKLLGNQAEAPRESVLVTIQSGSDHSVRPGLFCIHPVGGQVLCYRNLARLLGPEQAVYGLQAQGLEDNQSPLSDIAEMAKTYRRKIRAVQAQGPYALAGWSLGGVIAFEMARQWVEEGESLSLLALIDSQIETKPDEHAAFARNVRNEDWLRDLFQEDLERVLATAPVIGFSERLDLSPIVNERNEPSPDATDLRRINQSWRVFRACMQALADYVPLSFPGPVTLFCADESDAQNLAGWRALVPNGLQIHRIRGDHYSLLKEPAVHEVAEKIDACLNPTNLFVDAGGKRCSG
ncbi:MAG: amino acid adenylation domain-containing protein [Gammaproteobacteria bacterium]